MCEILDNKFTVGSSDDSLVLFLFAVTNQYSAALNFYLQAGAVSSDFFTKAVPPDVYTDQVCHSPHWKIHKIKK